jgi:hypothetical protein
MIWESGRQGTGYLKMVLRQGSFYDIFLIKYPVGTHIPAHIDPVPGKKHFRLNIRLKGENNFNGMSLFNFGRITLFRPDITPHSVKQVTKERLILSIGVAV